MKKLLVLVIISSCGFIPMTKTQNQVMSVKWVSPGENGLCTYCIKPDGMKGRIKLVDSNNKYHLGEKFILAK